MNKLRIGPKSGEGSYVMDGQTVIAHVFDGSGLAESLALFVAAPTLLDVCEESLEFVSAIYEGFDCETEDADIAQPWCEDLCGTRICNDHGCIRMKIHLLKTAIAQAKA